MTAQRDKTSTTAAAAAAEAAARDAAAKRRSTQLLDSNTALITDCVSLEGKAISIASALSVRLPVCLFLLHILNRLTDL